MKTFDLSILGGDNPKQHKIPQETLKDNWVDFPRDSAERLVELGYGRWLVTNSNSQVLVPVGVTYPEQVLFIRLKTHAVKAVHINSLLGADGPKNLLEYCDKLQANASFTHDPRDLMDEEGVEDYTEEEMAAITAAEEVADSVDEVVIPATKEDIGLDDLKNVLKKKKKK